MKKKMDKDDCQRWTHWDLYFPKLDPVVPFLLKHTLEIGFGPVNFHYRKCLSMKLIQYTYKFK